MTERIIQVVFQTAITVFSTFGCVMLIYFALRIRSQLETILDRLCRIEGMVKHVGEHGIIKTSDNVYYARESGITSDPLLPIIRDPSELEEINRQRRAARDEIEEKEAAAQGEGPKIDPNIF